MTPKEFWHRWVERYMPVATVQVINWDPVPGVHKSSKVFQRVNFVVLLLNILIKMPTGINNQTSFVWEKYWERYFNSWGTRYLSHTTLITQSSNLCPGKIHLPDAGRIYFGFLRHWRNSVKRNNIPVSTEANCLLVSTKHQNGKVKLSWVEISVLCTSFAQDLTFWWSKWGPKSIPFPWAS